MPPKRKSTTDDDDDEYRRKRDRNNQVKWPHNCIIRERGVLSQKSFTIYYNCARSLPKTQAVKRSRVKSKMKTEETQQRVNDLRLKNQLLEDKIDNQKKELKFLKELFITQAQAKADKLDGFNLNELLKDDDGDDEEEDEGQSSSKKRAKEQTYGEGSKSRSRR
uniref:BZIP domain-containing protein n=1 Tax=Anopheles epiroticus TaxID=199890 RepID=A0A182P3E7_9DIPT